MNPVFINSPQPSLTGIHSPMHTMVGQGGAMEHVQDVIIQLRDEVMQLRLELVKTQQELARRAVLLRNSDLRLQELRSEFGAGAEG